MSDEELKKRLDRIEEDHRLIVTFLAVIVVLAVLLNVAVWTK